MLVRFWEKLNRIVGIDLMHGKHVFITRKMVNELLVGLVIVVVSNVAAISLAVGFASDANDTASQAQTARKALCALRADLENRVEASKDFLRSHPNGVLGIPAKTIQINIVNQEHTIKALDNLHCTSVKSTVYKVKSMPSAHLYSTKAYPALYNKTQ